MATIRRHPVPPDSFRPEAPLNDLLHKQLEHFIHAAERLPVELRVELPAPSPDDSAGAARFIAAVTERLMSRKRPPLTVVNRSRRIRTKPGISIAAAAEMPHTQPAKHISKRRKSKSRKQPKKSSGA